jgi:hypothetical protein
MCFRIWRTISNFNSNRFTPLTGSLLELRNGHCVTRNILLETCVALFVLGIARQSQASLFAADPATRFGPLLANFAARNRYLAATNRLSVITFEQL